MKKSSGHDRMTVLINSKQLWLPTQDQHKIKLVNIIARRRKGFTSILLTEKLWTFDGYYGRED